MPAAVEKSPRIGSPVGGSILITSAPQSAMIPPAAGPATQKPISMTRTPSRGPAMRRLIDRPPTTREPNLEGGAPSPPGARQRRTAAIVTIPPPRRRRSGALPDVGLSGPVAWQFARPGVADLAQRDAFRWRALRSAFDPVLLAVARRSQCLTNMAILLMFLLVVGYGASVWSLGRQTHFHESQARKPRSRRHGYHGWRRFAGETR